MSSGTLKQKKNNHYKIKGLDLYPILYKYSDISLNYFNSSKLLTNKHDPYLEKFVMSLVLENKVDQAINIIKLNSKKSNTNFFESYILLILDQYFH